MLKKRAAMDALIPDMGKKTLGNSSGIVTELLPNPSLTITGSDTSIRQHRRRPLQEKAVSKTYSFYPRTIKGLEKYADENGMTYSQVINLSLRQLIPKSYFEDD